MTSDDHKGIRSIFNASDRESALERLGQIVEKYREKAPKLADWMEANIPQGLTVLDPKLNRSEPTRKCLRTSNGLERVNKELKRRTRVATLVPNEESLLRLVSTLLMEISEEWEIGRVYIIIERSG